MFLAFELVVGMEGWRGGEGRGGEGRSIALCPGKKKDMAAFCSPQSVNILSARLLNHSSDSELE